MITADQRHALLLADRTRDVGVITAAIADVVAANPEITLLEIETAFRDAAASAYVVVDGSEFRIVLGFKNWIAALAVAGVMPVENRLALANRPG